MVWWIAPRILVPMLLALVAPAIALASETVTAGNEGKAERATTDIALSEGPTDELLTLGREVFTQTAEPQCALCHTLLEADATGEIGPNLDEVRPGAEKVAAAVREGLGVMPAYGDLLSEQQIEAVSAYVAAVAGNGGTAD